MFASACLSWVWEITDEIDCWTISLGMLRGDFPISQLPFIILTFLRGNGGIVWSKNEERSSRI